MTEESQQSSTLFRQGHQTGAHKSLFKKPIAFIAAVQPSPGGVSLNHPNQSGSRGSWSVTHHIHPFHHSLCISSEVVVVPSQSQIPKKGVMFQSCLSARTGVKFLRVEKVSNRLPIQSFLPCGGRFLCLLALLPNGLAFFHPYTSLLLDQQQRRCISNSAHLPNLLLAATS